MRVGPLKGLLAVGIGVVASPVFASETITYTYDALGRLITVVHSGTVNNNMQTVYTMDAADNRNSVTITGAPH
jgi:hypothetical protein